MNKTCPKCGSDGNGKPAPKELRFWCSSSAWENGDFYQSPECVRRERDNLLERVKRLEDALRRIANTDYRGNRSTESQIAFDALNPTNP